MNYDIIACIYQLATQIYNISHVEHHVHDAMYLCANNNVHHYQPACDWLEAHKDETTKETYDNLDAATQIYFLCQSILNTWPHAKLVLPAIEYCALCKYTPAIHWATGYWTSYISCVMSNSNETAGWQFHYRLLRGANHNHPILQNLLTQIIKDKTQKVNGFPNELPERIECPYYDGNETDKACSYGMDEGWDEKPEMCGYDHDIRKKGDGNMLKCDLFNGWLSPDFKSFPSDLVSLNKTYSSKDWLDGYCASFLNYRDDCWLIKPLSNREFVLTMLCLDRFHAPEELRKRIIKNLSPEECERTNP